MRIKKDLVGKKFGNLIVLDEYRLVPNGTEWKCKCDCGNEIYIYRGRITSGQSTSCGCTKSPNIISARFGKLVVMDSYIKIPNGTKWECQCDCGNRIFVYRGKLTTGHTQSCGCLTETLGGLSKTRLYKEWWSIKERCYKEYHASYHNYGAKGIRLCDEWLDFKTFYDWAMANGYSDDLTIDRKDSDGDYSPVNCQWISLKENVAKANKENHRRKTKFIYYAISPDGKRYEFTNASEFSKEHGLYDNSVRRVARGERPHYKGWKFGFTNELNL
jgi:hypothetical protein